MKIRHSLLAIAAVLTGTAQAQTLNVRQDANVIYAFNASECGEMTYSNGGSTLTIQGKAFDTSAISSVYVDDSSVADNAVSVVYNSTSASVVIAGNVAAYVSATVSGANVVIDQVGTPEAEITYTLSGASSAGSFTMNGETAATFALSDLTLTSTTSAAIDIEDSKRISLVLTGTNTLSDYAGGTQNACFYIDGHAVISGSGTLNITGNAKHGLTLDEHAKMLGGTVNILAAASDGIHGSEYFYMEDGQLNIQATGDGIDLGFRGVNKGTKDQYEDNGFIKLMGGTVSIATTGTATKALKADSTIVCGGATVTASTTGSATYDETEADFSSCAALKTGGNFQMTAGNVDLSSTGAGGKGVNATYNVNVSGGRLTVTTTGAPYENDDDDDTKPHGIKASGNINLTGGEVYVAASAKYGMAFKTKNTFAIDGSTVMGIGGTACAATDVPSTQLIKYYTKTGVSAGATKTYDGVSYTVPSYYSNSNAKILVSCPQ